MENNKKSNGVIVGILIGIIIMLLVFVALFTTNTITFTSKTNNDDKTTNTKEDGISESEAIEIGKKLYDKAIEVQKVIGVLPYCGYSREEILNKKTTNFGITNPSDLAYYETDYTNLDSLREALKNSFKESIVNYIANDTNSEIITDVSKLKDNETASYVIYNNKLYCRRHVRKGYLYFYLDEYDINIDNIEKNKITYSIKSTYVKDGANNTKCTTDNPNNCTENDKEYKDTKFVIEKINNNWVVSEYTMFGYDANENARTLK